MSNPRPKSSIDLINEYQPGTAKLPGVEKTHRLAFNESRIGASPKAIAAAKATMDCCCHYPLPGTPDLVAAIAAHFRVDEKKLFCGAGSEDILRLIANGYANTGDDIVYTEHGILIYPIAAYALGANPIAAPEKNLHVDVDSILETVTPATKIVYVANPGNPTGTYIPAAEMNRLRDNLEDNIILVIDSAYAEFVNAKDYSSGWELVDNGKDNVVMTRTFSKMYGLAGLRVGWAYAPASVVKTLHKVRGGFNVNSAACAAAIEALADQAHADKAKAYNDETKLWLEQQLVAFGLEISPSVANFVLIRFPGGELQCNAINDILRKSGISVKKCSVAGLPNCLRVTIGPRESLELMVTILEEILGRK
jgi:histidinol-phosphate aminotransferase